MPTFFPRVSLACWAASAMSAAVSGVAQLVPPITCHAGLGLAFGSLGAVGVSYTSTPPLMAAFIATSGSVRWPFAVFLVA